MTPPSTEPDLNALLPRLAQALLARGHGLGTAESCTGGLIAAACTDLAGSSAWFDSGVVSYSNEAKQDLLGVPAALIAAHGAVSEPVALAMVQGAQAAVARHRPGAWAVAVTGIAGPTGGSADKPVGTVWVAWAGPGQAPRARRFQFDGDRQAVRAQTVVQALAGLLALVEA
ncbi:MAG: hypothetical protein RI907_665 [Pseudomonadota bacterium]|jgi:nicotinamide-nucleotide amidase